MGMFSESLSLSHSGQPLKRGPAWTAKMDPYDEGRVINYGLPSMCRLTIYLSSEEQTRRMLLSEPSPTPAPGDQLKPEFKEEKILWHGLRPKGSKYTDTEISSGFLH